MNIDKDFELNLWCVKEDMPETPEFTLKDQVQLAAERTLESVSRRLMMIVDNYMLGHQIEVSKAHFE